MKLLVTGAAGFIGSALSMKLLARGDEVIGVDNHNDYYDVTLKEARLKKFYDHKGYTHFQEDIKDKKKNMLEETKMKEIRMHWINLENDLFKKNPQERKELILKKLTEIHTLDNDKTTLTVKWM